MLRMAIQVFTYKTVKFNLCKDLYCHAKQWPATQVKSYISRHGGILWEAMMEKDDTDVYCLLSQAVYSVTEESTKGWFEHSGYSCIG
jgi:hypothetical protein